MYVLIVSELNWMQMNGWCLERMTEKVIWQVSESTWAEKEGDLGEVVVIRQCLPEMKTVWEEATS